MELLMEQKEQSSLQKVDITILEEQLEAAKQEKTELDQRLIRLKFELEDPAKIGRASCRERV